MLKNFKVGLKLYFLALIFIVGFFSFGGIAFQTISEIKINGDIYKQIIQGKDVVADILPPPEYIIETQLTVYELVNTTDKSKISELQQKLKNLEAEYNKYHNILESDLPEGDLKKELIETSYNPVKDYYDILNSEVFSKVEAGKNDEAEEILNSQLTPLYNEHRSSIDKVVNLANQQNTQIEQQTENIIKKDLMILVSVALGILVIALVFCIFIIRSIAKPLVFLTEQLKTFSAGDFSTEIPEKYLRGKDELGDIAKAASMMQESTILVINQVKSLSADVVRLSSYMEQTADNNAKKSEQVAMSTVTMAESATTQNTFIMDIKQQIEENVQNINGGFQKADEMLKNAKASSVVAENGSNYIMEVIEQFSWVRKTVEFATESIQNLGKRSNEIDAITDVITGIASQTNLLALNASIEAARSGEHGKGFAVVAEEIRTLSENTAEAAEEITRLIKDIQEETEVGVHTMEKNLEHVNTQIDAIQKGKEALETMVVNVKTTKEKAGEIFDLCLQVHKKMENINVTTNEMSLLISDSAAYAEEVAASSEEQNVSNKEITTSSVELAVLAENLQKEIDRFRSKEAF